MTDYVIGDIQGCFRTFLRLLDAIDFDTRNDRLYCTGDLINRGPDSAAVVAFVSAHTDNIFTVLGNHEFHFLALDAGITTYLAKDDTAAVLLHSPDRTHIVSWLRRQPLVRILPDDSVLVHAGIPPQWTLETALLHARTVEAVLQSDAYHTFIRAMYGNKPAHWDNTHHGMARLRYIVNAYTRMRLCTKHGTLMLDYKGPPVVRGAYVPWYRHRKSENNTNPHIYFGHWAALGAQTFPAHNATCVDSGAVWGRTMTAIRLSDKKLFSVANCEERNDAIIKK